MRALALLSGGLDSTLATKLILDQGIEVEALNFVSPFCLCNKGGKCHSSEVAQKFGIPLKVMAKGEDYLQVVRHPKYGYGSAINPCIDCRIYMFRKTREYAEQTGAKFIFTGEVLGQRPMSQHRRAIELIDRESGLKGKVLRPLSARRLPETEAEKMGWVHRERLLDIRGRSRRQQIRLAGELGITDYPCPAGGCLLTQKEFAERVRELFRHKEQIAVSDVLILKVGRHFWNNGSHIIVGRNQSENQALLSQRKPEDYIFEVPDYPSPITILEGAKDSQAMELAARLTAKYSDADTGEVLVEFRNDKTRGTVTVQLPVT